MLDADVEEDRKLFQDDAAGQDNVNDEADPEEIMEFNAGEGRIWLVKVPKFLMERWGKVAAPDVHLATMRVYNGGSKISLFLPNAPQLAANSKLHPSYHAEGLMTEYALDVVNPGVENQVVISERPTDPPNGRARSTRLLGNVIHECNIRPNFNDSYRETVAARHRAANTPKRQIVMLGKDDVRGGVGGLNKLSSGAAVATHFDSFVKTTKKTGKEFERYARIPKDQLLDMLFAIFAEKSNWSFKELRARTEQPAEYLKEVLQLIATLHRSGELNGQYTLLENYRDRENQDMVKSSNVDDFGSPSTSMQQEQDEDEDEDED